MYKRYAELCANVFKDRQEVSVLMWLACIPYGSHHSMLMMLMHTHTHTSTPCPSYRRHLSCDDCLEAKREDDQNGSVLCCACTMITHTNVSSY